jgi:hypothetical protein
MGWVIAFTCMGMSFVLLGRLSQRMGTMTHARPYYVGFYLAAVFMWGGAFMRLLDVTNSLAVFPEIVQNSIYVLLADGLPALAITIALLVAWYYWSWLLAERD